jgi:hypothetical protein
MTSDIDYQNWHTHVGLIAKDRDMGGPRNKWQDKFLKLPDIGIGFNYHSVILQERKNKETEAQYHRHSKIIISTKATHEYIISLF